MSRRETVRDLSHEGGEMKAVPRGLNTELMRDSGADSLGRRRFYTADALCKHAFWPISCTFPGPDDNTKTDSV